MNACNLSIVATSRNDDHGENLLYRMQYFVTGVIEQCEKHKIKSELILVEWNPPQDRLPLSEILKYPKKKKYLTIRIIQVPNRLHQSFENSEKLPLYQMIAKNVGIRRAKGKFVIATNIDILFSDQLCQFFKQRLSPRTLYRVNRYDVPSKLPENASFKQILDFCGKEYFRINKRFGTQIKVNGVWVKEKYTHPMLNKFFFKKIKKFLKNLPYKKMYKIHKFYKIFQFIQKPLIRFLFDQIKYYGKKIKRIKLCIQYNLHTNACGDFTLLSLQAWQELRGYPEWPYYSWHIDSVFLYQAKSNGFRHRALSAQKRIYHIEHGLGSGYTAELPNALFDRLEKNNIPYINDSKLNELIIEMKNKGKRGKKVIYNDKSWGLGNFKLEETVM